MHKSQHYVTRTKLARTFACALNSQNESVSPAPLLLLLLLFCACVCVCDGDDDDDYVQLIAYCTRYSFVCARIRAS